MSKERFEVGGEKNKIVLPKEIKDNERLKSHKSKDSKKSKKKIKVYDEDDTPTSSSSSEDESDCIKRRTEKKAITSN